MRVVDVTRLTDAQRRDRAVSERDFQRLVTELALMLGWDWAHFRPAQTSKGWRTPVSGTIGEGWPDVVLVRGRDRRLIFADLKREGGLPTIAQLRVLDVLRSLELDGSFVEGAVRVATGRTFPLPRIQVELWQPSDLTSGHIQAVLS